MEKNTTQYNFIELSRQEQKSVLEVIVFASDEPVSTEMLNTIFNLKPNSEKTKEENADSEEEIFDFENLMQEINDDLDKTGRPFQIIKNAGGYVYSSKFEYGELLQRISKYKVKKRLSQAALETLAIIAYKQPISKPEIEQIRGINSNEIVNSLIEKELVEITGRKEIIGKPLLYGTSLNFLKTFGINSIDELPKLKEIDEILSTQDIESDSSVIINIEDIEEKQETKIEIPEYTEIIEKDATFNSIET